MKTSKKQFEIFSRCVNEWIKRLGLVQYSLAILHEKIEGNSIATCCADFADKTCVFTFNTENLMENGDDEEIEAIAVHEVCHLLLTPITDLAEARYSWGQIKLREEGIINTLEKTLVR